MYHIISYHIYHIRFLVAVADTYCGEFERSHLFGLMVLQGLVHACLGLCSGAEQAYMMKEAVHHGKEAERTIRRDQGSDIPRVHYFQVGPAS